MTWRPTDAPVVITCALTGGIHGKEANENLPEQPDEIVEQGVAAARAGAAILHVHARNPDGSNTMSREIYGELHERLCAETDAIVQLTTGGQPAVVARGAHQHGAAGAGDVLAEHGAAELLHPRRAGVLRQPPRRHRALRPRDRASATSSPSWRSTARRCSRRSRTCSSWRSSTPPYALNFVLHTPTQGGTRGTPGNLLDLVARLAELPVARDQLRVTVTSMGATQLPITTMAIAMGLNVRVGMEDNVLYRRGEPVREQRPAGRAHGADRA